MNQSLHELFINKLKKLYTAETEIATALPKMAMAATDEKLKAAFEEHLLQTNDHIRRLENVLTELGETADIVPNKIIMAILAEGEEIINKDLDSDVLNASLIAEAQVVEHYEIAAYGAVIAWAKEMEHDVDQLTETLEEEKAADKKLSGIAEGGIFTEGINEKAEEE